MSKVRSGGGGRIDSNVQYSSKNASRAPGLYIFNSIVVVVVVVPAFVEIYW